jgi:cytochrome c-type biogenesis protein CcmH/NrfF
MNKLLAALLLALCTLTASADVVIEEPKKSASPLIWMAPAGLAIAIAAGVAARRKRRTQP